MDFRNKLEIPVISSFPELAVSSCIREADRQFQKILESSWPESCGSGGNGIGFGAQLPPFSFSFADTSLPLAKKAIFHGPATIVIWADGTKTVVKCSEDDTFSKETGIALCFMKKALGNNGCYNNTLRRLLKESDHG